MKNQSKSNVLNTSDKQLDITLEDEEIEDSIIVKILTKNGILKFTIKENDPFKKVYEDLAKLEKTNIDNLVLMLKDKKINHTDTPKSINLKVYDLIECGRCAAVVKERIQIIENFEEAEIKTEPNEISIMLQTQEGRKSRIRFLILKDEKLINVLKVYCDKKSLDVKTHILEFDGDKIDEDETPASLDLDGDEMIDVIKSSKPTSQRILEKSNVYAFDDDVLCV